MQSLIQTIIYILTITLPLTFTLNNSELFEFPKFILLLSGTIAITLAWGIHIYKSQDYKIFTPSLLNYSVLGILGSALISTIFSIHPYTSFWGYYSRFHGGSLTIICYTIIYFAALKWMDKKSTQKFINISIITSILVGIYALLERLGIDKQLWVQDVQSRPFSTLGQPNWLAAYMIPNIFLAIYQNISSKNRTLWSYFFIVITMLALILTRSRSGLIGFVLSFITYFLLVSRSIKFKSIQKEILKYIFVFIALALYAGTPYIPSLNDLLSRANPAPLPAVTTGTALENGGTESGDIRKIVWAGAINIIQKYPLLGRGLETFAYTYYGSRPVSHNMTSEWDFLYNKAHNEYLNIASGAGLVGLLAYLLFHYAVFALSLKVPAKSKKVNQDELDKLRYLYPVLAATMLGFAVTNFFGFSVIPVYFLTMLVATLPHTITKESTLESSTVPPSFYFVLPVLLLYPLKIYMADLNYAKGKAFLDASQPANAVTYLQKAQSSRYGLDLYHATLAEAYAQLGQIEPALKEAQINKDLNPHHLNFYKSRAKVYLTLASIDTKYHEQAKDELVEARRLAPTDPKLAYNLGLVYARLSDLSGAESSLKDAIALKPNYVDPYYALTLLYEQDKKVGLIPDLLKSAQTNLATYPATLKEKIEKYTNL